MTRRRTAAQAALPLTLALALTACGGGGGGGAGGGAAAPPAAEQGVSDINATDAATLRDGGDLRWPIQNYPQNLNYHHFDGTEGDNAQILDTFMPQVHLADAEGTLELDPDYVTSVEVTSEEPLTITYTINPEAVWSDGTPITWVDFQAQWQALNGTNPAYNISSSNAYDQIASVEQGVDERQAVVTFAEPYGDWRAAFSPLYPASTNGDPEVFNNGWLEGAPVTSGPFRPASFDRTAQEIVLERNPDWWGSPAKLDRIIFRNVESAAQANALANNEIELFEISSDVALFERAQQIPGAVVRRAQAPDRRHITFNGAEGSILADQELRTAIQQGIDRTPIAQALIGRIVPDAEPLGNHIFNQGQEGYQDNDAVVEHDPAAAEATLDRLGWVRGPDGVRARDGQTLTIRNVIPTGTAASEQEARIAQEQLRAIGVDMQIQAVPVNDFFERHILVGDFDMTHFAWLGTPLPIGSTESIYSLQEETQQNFGRIGTEEINALYTEANTELDEARRIELANQIDTLIWEAGHSLMLYQRPNVWAVRDNLANVGAFGFADERWQDIGFVQ